MSERDDLIDKLDSLPADGLSSLAYSVPVADEILKLREETARLEEARIADAAEWGRRIRDLDAEVTVDPEAYGRLLQRVEHLEAGSAAAQELARVADRVTHLENTPRSGWSESPQTHRIEAAVVSSLSVSEIDALARLVAAGVRS